MSKVKDAVVGLAVGDAMGVPIETYKREDLIINPVTEMKGFMAHNFPKGYWSDDTSLTLATLDSISKTQKFDYEDIMNNFMSWLYDGKYTPSGIAFGIGNTCKLAIDNYKNNKINVLAGINNIKNNGNGSIMRILPAALYSYYNKCNAKETYEISKNLSSLTHSHEISIIGCYIMVNYLIFLLKGFNKLESYYYIQNVDYSMFSLDNLKKYNRVLKNKLINLKESEISSLWYVIDTLESSLYSIINTSNYHDAIIKAINLGGDTDTVGAVTGAMAGIIYGIDDIPKSWLNDLYNKQYIENICDRFEKKLKIK